jgi:hypothetical protein
MGLPSAGGCERLQPIPFFGATFLSTNFLLSTVRRGAYTSDVVKKINFFERK